MVSLVNSVFFYNFAVNRHSYMVRDFIDRYRVYILFIAALLPILILRDFTPANELRYLSIASDALRDGHFFAFSNQGIPYSDKPPLYLWIAMAAYALMGTHSMWLLGMFSAIPAIITAELTLRICGDRISGAHHNTARLAILTTVLFLAMSFTIRMDMLMVMFITAAIWSFMRISREEGNLRRNQWSVGLFVFLALFSKGPLGVLIPLVSLIVYLYSIKQLKKFGRYWGWRCWTILIAGCLVWWGCAYAEGGMEYINSLLFHQTVDRAMDAFHHKQHWSFYLVQMWWVMAPWSLLLVVQLLARLYGTDFQNWSREETMCTSIVIATLIMLSAISSKLPVYLLPVSAFWVAALIMTTTSEGKPWQRWLLALPAAALMIAAAMGAIGMKWILDWMMPKVGISSIGTFSFITVELAAISLSVGMALAFTTLVKAEGELYKGIRYMGYAILATVFFAGLAIPAFNPLMGLGGVAEEASKIQKEVKADKIVTLEMKRSENIDVYFQERVYAAANRVELEHYLELPGSTLLICKESDFPMETTPMGIRHITNKDGKSIYYIEKTPSGILRQQPFMTYE